MTYILDSSCFIVLGHYFPARFPTFWEMFNKCVESGGILSVREVYHELDKQVTRPHLRKWMDDNKRIFLLPHPEETLFISQIFSLPKFQALIKRKQLLTSGPAADPFIIASAKIKGACVVTEESKKDSVVRIPTVCEHFNIDCTNLEGLMEREDWKF